MSLNLNIRRRQPRPHSQLTRQPTNSSSRTQVKHSTHRIRHLTVTRSHRRTNTSQLPNRHSLTIVSMNRNIIPNQRHRPHNHTQHRPSISMRQVNHQLLSQATSTTNMTYSSLSLSTLNQAHSQSHLKHMLLMTQHHRLITHQRISPRLRATRPTLSLLKRLKVRSTTANHRPLRQTQRRRTLITIIITVTRTTVRRMNRNLRTTIQVIQRTNSMILKPINTRLIRRRREIRIKRLQNTSRPHRTRTNTIQNQRTPRHIRRTTQNQIIITKGNIRHHLQ